MKLRKILFGVMAGAFFMVSCSSDDNSSAQPDVPAGVYDNGLFVLNEGNSNVSSATVTFVGADNTAQQDIYKVVNQSAPALGSYLQSMFFDDTRAFIISGQANKVTVVNRYTFEFIASVDTNFSSPRYGTIIGNKAYITNYADFNTGLDDFLTVINLDDYTTSKINTGNWSEKITEITGKLYIANGYFGDGTSVTVFNPVTGTAEKVIELGISPNAMQEDDGMLYVVGGNKIFTINLADNQVVSGVTLPQGVTDARNIGIDGNAVYFTSETAVYKMEKNNNQVAQVFSYQSNSDFGGMYGFAVNDGKIYIADGGNFSSDSEIYIYTLTGNLINTLPAGVGPNGFYFNN